MADNNTSFNSPADAGDETITMTHTQFAQMLRDNAEKARSEIFDQMAASQSVVGDRRPRDTASTSTGPPRSQPQSGGGAAAAQRPTPPAPAAGQRPPADSRTLYAVANAAMSQLDASHDPNAPNYLDVDGAIQALDAANAGQPDALLAMLPVLLAAAKNTVQRNHPGYIASVPNHHVLESTEWAQHLRTNNHAAAAITSGLEKYFRTTLSGNFNTHHMMMLSLERFIKAAARDPTMADDPDFCEGCNLLIRELAIDQMSKNGTDGPGLQAARDRARSSKLPDVLKDMQTVAVERNKQAKKGN
jgi:hypothetical protein